MTESNWLQQNHHFVGFCNSVILLDSVRFCSLVAPQKSGLIVHVATVHKGKKKFECEIWAPLYFGTPSFGT